MVITKYLDKIRENNEEGFKVLDSIKQNDIIEDVLIIK